VANNDEGEQRDDGGEELAAGPARVEIISSREGFGSCAGEGDGLAPGEDERAAEDEEKQAR